MEEDLYTRIEDYLDHQLDAAARTAFEAALSADPELAEALAQVSEARTRLGRAWAQQEADDALHNTLQQLGREHFSNAVAGSPNPPLVAVRGRRWWIAAAAAVFAILLIWFFRAPSPADLYARYDQFPEAAFGTRAIGDSTQLNLVAAETAFNAGRYLEALPLLQRYLTSHPADQEKRFFSTLCQLALGQTTEAALFFRQLQAAPTYTDEADWYLALTFLKAKNTAACAEQLQRIPTNSRHYEEAQQLLKKLD